MLIEHRRLDPGTDTLTFLRLIQTARGVTIAPITAEIAGRSATLPIHGDPADRIIAATAIEHGARLVTSDRKLRSSQQVQTLW